MTCTALRARVTATFNRFGLLPADYGSRPRAVGAENEEDDIGLLALEGVVRADPAATALGLEPPDASTQLGGHHPERGDHEPGRFCAQPLQQGRQDLSLLGDPLSLPSSPVTCHQVDCSHHLPGPPSSTAWTISFS